MVSSHPSEKYESVSLDDEIPNGKNKKCSKPPTSGPWSVVPLNCRRVIRLKRTAFFTVRSQETPVELSHGESKMDGALAANNGFHHKLADGRCTEAGDVGDLHLMLCKDFSQIGTFLRTVVDIRKCNFTNSTLGLKMMQRTQVQT